VAVQLHLGDNRIDLFPCGISRKRSGPSHRANPTQLRLRNAGNNTITESTATATEH